jgi:lipopolysaccharide transport system permease protein
MAGMMNQVRKLYKHRDLLWMWTQREIQIRYKQSVLGAGWALLQPLALMVMFTIVFSYFLDVPSDGLPYPLFSYAAVLPWTLLATSLGFAIPSLVNNMNLVTKIYFPREILPLGAIGAALTDFLVAGLVFVGMMVWYRVPLTWNILWLPVILAVELLIILGVTLPMSAMNVFYRDIRFIIPLALQLWMYASPVIYPISLVPEELQNLYALNPMVGVLDAYRQVLLHGEAPNLAYFRISAEFGVVLVVVGYWFFKRVEEKFADII